MSQNPAPIHLLPPNDELRTVLHNEVHARPAARIRLPALIVYVAVLNADVTRAQECEHLRHLPGQQALTPESLAGNFLRLRFEGYSVKWERHTEFTRYSIVQPLPPGALLGATEPDLNANPAVPFEWLRNLPGRTVAAIQMAMVEGDITNEQVLMAQAQQWFGGSTVLASQLGNRVMGAQSGSTSGVSSAGHSWAVTQFHIGGDGFERILVIAPPHTTQARLGRISRRLLEVETYRLMALRGLPVAKELGPMLAQCEAALADITAQLESKTLSDQALLDTMISLAVKIERATAAHVFRFSATTAYSTLVQQRIAELREKAIPGTEQIGTYLQHRLSPAMATVAATAQRLASLSERISRASALLRTRVDIATELQNQQLLEKLTRGQELQLRLQATVEGLSIAAISYYVISLLLYGGKALKGAGVPINPEIAAGALVPLVLWAVWWGTRHIRNKVRADK